MEAAGKASWILGKKMINIWFGKQKKEAQIL